MNPDSRSSDLAIGVDLDTMLGTADESGLDSAGVAAILHATGTVMRQVRRARGLTIADTAPQCGVSSSVLCRVELARREPRLHLLLALCGFLGVRLSAVLRIAENDALPIGALPWTADPAELLSPSFRSGSALLDQDGGVGHG
jgi:transcriptional regulator with XRE-family HTH domain